MLGSLLHDDSKRSAASAFIITAMTPALLLTIYCIAILLASLAGGWITMIVRLTHRRLELALSFVSGVMLGISLLHMLPHALAQFDAGTSTHNHSGLTAMWWVLGGFLGIFLLERFFPFHHHESDDAPELEHKHDHSHDESCDVSTRHLSWPAALLGFTVHSIVAGMVLAAAVEVESTSGVAAAGLGVFLVIVLHKPFDSIAVGTLMAADKSPKLNRHIVNSLFGLIVPLGVVGFAFGLSNLNIAQGPMLGAILALASGVFLCIALSDVLPELQFHRHDRVKLSAALILGIALAGVIAHFEAKAHQHDHANEVIVDEPDHDHDH